MEITKIKKTLDLITETKLPRLKTRNAEDGTWNKLKNKNKNMQTKFLRMKSKKDHVRTS